jgi:hypothetical protein
MDVNEYRVEFTNELRSDAAINNTDTDDEFVRHSLQLLEELGELQDSVQFYYGKNGKRNRMMQFHAYAYDDADGSIILVISDFKDTYEPETLTNTQIDILYKRMLSFIDEAYMGNIEEYCDDADETINIAREFKYRIGSQKCPKPTLKFKFFIITNAKLSDRVKTIKKPYLFDKPLELNLWTIERFFENVQSSKNEPILIDVSDYGLEGIPCLKAEMSDGLDYDAYLAIVPGKFLADIYLDYGSRLLEGNVRAFLSARGKVNSGIRNTIIKEPTKFFTYNNGIATTAESVEIGNTKSGLCITLIKDLQIINGGQTTASLASAVIKNDNKELNDIYVPMKLTVVKPVVDLDLHEQKYNEMIEKISKSANCQNPVKESDFFSNSQFHVHMEKMSRQYMAPPAHGVPFSTVWYYERSRNKWEQEQFKFKKAEREKFKSKFPKNQRVTKEKLAKCYNALQCLPHIVSKGSANNMMYFGAQIEEKYKKSKDEFNEYFFKKAISSVIVFDSIDKLVGDQEWYPKGGNKAQIVPYTIARIVSGIPKGYSINFNMIWQRQGLFPSFIREAEIVSKLTHEYLADSNGAIVREYAKNKNTWDRFQHIPYKLTSEFLKDLVVISDEIDEEKRARKDQKIDNDLDVEVEVVKFGADYWIKLLESGKEKKFLTPKEIDLLKLGASLNDPKPKIPTSIQAKRIMEIRSKLGEEGLII